MEVDALSTVDDVLCTTSDLLKNAQGMELDDLQQAITARDQMLLGIGNISQLPAEHHAVIADKIQQLVAMNKSLLQIVLTRQTKLASDFSSLKSANKAVSSYLKY